MPQIDQRVAVQIGAAAFRDQRRRQGRSRLGELSEECEHAAAELDHVGVERGCGQPLAAPASVELHRRQHDFQRRSQPGTAGAVALEHWYPEALRPIQAVPGRVAGIGARQHPPLSRQDGKRAGGIGVLVDGVIEALQIREGENGIAPSGAEHGRIQQAGDRKALLARTVERLANQTE